MAADKEMVRKRMSDNGSSDDGTRDDGKGTQNEMDGGSDGKNDAVGKGAEGVSGPMLAEVLKKYEITLPAKKTALLERYCEALWDWNRKLNLTRHTDYEKFVTRDLIDTLRLSEHLQKGEHILDVGTGGGVPGVVLAILRPDLNVELCDSTGKKAVAVGAIVDSLGLDLNVWHAKAEELVRAHRFHTLVIRAVSKLEKLLRMFSTTWFAFDRILMIKGPGWVEERGEARHYGLLTNLALRKVADYVNPGMEHESVILQVCQKKRFAEIEARAKDLAAGIPIVDSAEVVAIETEWGAKKRMESKGPRRSGGRTGGDRKRGNGGHRWVTRKGERSGGGRSGRDYDRKGGGISGKGRSKKSGDGRDRLGKRPNGGRSAGTTGAPPE